jgi:hypothetical protein
MKTIKHRWELINELILRNDYKNYLEIGLNNGECFRQIFAENKVSVDPAMGEYAHANPTYKMTSDVFFETVAKDLPKFDIIFIDGLHESQQVDRDILNGLERLSDNGAIILHDCNPRNKEAQEVPRRVKVWNGDVWKSLVKYRLTGEWLAFTLDTDEGLGVILKGTQSAGNISVKDWEQYEVFDEYRTLLLDLRAAII